MNWSNLSSSVKLGFALTFVLVLVALCRFALDALDAVYSFTASAKLVKRLRGASMQSVMLTSAVVVAAAAAVLLLLLWFMLLLFWLLMSRLLFCQAFFCC